MDVGQGCSIFRYLRFFVAGFGDDDLIEQAFGIPAFEDHFFVEIQYLREISLAEVWVVAGEGLLLQDRDEILGKINCGTGGKGGDGSHDY